MTQETQSYKEQATIMGIQLGLALMRRDSAVVGIKADGSEEIVSESLLEDDAWKDALEALQNKVEVTTLSYEKLHIFTDGGSRGNPGPSASGYVIMTTEEHILEEGGEYLGITTNNQAEYQAVKLALEQARKFTTQRIDFFIDSLLVVNQMNGVWKIKNKDLWPVHDAIKTIAKGFKSVTFTHVYREFNTLADEQVNIILDSRNHEKKQHKPRHEAED